MAVETTTNRIDYAGDNVSAVFAYPFRTTDQTYLEVRRTSALGIVTLLTLTTHYSVSGVDNPSGGNVTLTTPLLTGEVLGILRVVPLKQTATYPVGNKFPSTTHERVVDLLTMITQQITETFGRALKLGKASTQKDKDVDDLVALKFLRVKADVSGVEMADIPAGTTAFPITTAQGGLGADVSVSAARGDLLYRTAGLIFARLAKGARGALLSFDANDPVMTAAGAKGGLLLPDANTDLGWLAVGADGHMPEAASGASRGLQWSMPRDFGQGILTYVSATSLKFLPYNGQKLPVKTSGTFRLRDIGSAGVVSADPTAASNYVGGVANQQLAASTTYLVTVFDNAGTLTFDFIAGASAAVPGTHAPDANTGVEIKTQGGADDTRTVVGQIRTNASRQFVNSAAQRWTRTWFNDPGIGATAAFTANRSTTSGTYAELNTEIRNEPLVWAGEVVVFNINGGQANTDGAIIGHYSIGIDGTTAEDTMSATYTDATISQATAAATLVKTGLAEGYHYATLLARRVGGGGTTLTATGSATPGERTVLQTYIHK